MTTKQLNLKNMTHYFYNDLINIKNFDHKNLRLDKKSVFNNDVSYIEYITKKHEYSINSVNPLYLMINRIKAHFEEVDGDKYVVISSENGDIMQKYQEVFDGIKEIIKKIYDYSQPVKYDDNYMRIKFNTDGNISLNKIIYFPKITIIIRSVTQKDDKCYPQIFLDECLYQV